MAVLSTGQRRHWCCSPLVSVTMPQSHTKVLEAADLCWSSGTDEQSVVKVRLHSTSGASSRPALLLPHIQAVLSVVAPCPRGASLVSVRRRTFTTDC